MNPRNSYAVIALIKPSVSFFDSMHNTTTLFYRKDGAMDRARTLVDNTSWKSLTSCSEHLTEDVVDRTLHSASDIVAWWVWD